VPAKAASIACRTEAANQALLLTPQWRILAPGKNVIWELVRCKLPPGSTRDGEVHMTDQTKDQALGRRDFLKGAVVGGAAAATTTGLDLARPAQAQTAAGAAAAGYSFLNLEEAAFVEALVDHMVPADELTPKGTDVGINIYIDRALAGAWGKGDRLYMQGPWKPGVPSQGYQLPLTPAQLYRAGIEATNAYCRKTYGKAFDRLDETQREEVLIGLSSGKVSFEGGLPARVFWTTVYQTVMEGMFADPIYGGNRDKVGWKMINFPGVIEVNRENVAKYLDKPFPTNPLSIADMS
jgi:gluconate 2-dehydrogenase gamma chain